MGRLRLFVSDDSGVKSWKVTVLAKMFPILHPIVSNILSPLWVPTDAQRSWMALSRGHEAHVVGIEV